MIQPLTDVWPALYYDGVTPQRQDVTLRLGPGDVSVEGEHVEALRWPYREIRIAQGEYAGEPVRLERGETSAVAIVVEDRRFLEAFRQFSPDSERTERPLGWRQIVLALLALAATAFGSYFWGAQTVGRAFAAVIPTSWEQRLGAAAENALAPDEVRCDDPDKQAAIEAIVSRIREAAPDSRYEYTVTVARGPMNAFAAPGGKIVVFDGLLQITDSAEELAGVLAHEIQHVEQRHSTQALFRQMTMSALLSAAGGDGGAWALDSGLLLSTLAHMRADEAAADREGLKALEAAGIDGRGMVKVFRKFANFEGALPSAASYLMTHPASEGRAAQLEAELSQVENQPLLPETAWGKIRRPCRN